MAPRTGRMLRTAMMTSFALAVVLLPMPLLRQLRAEDVPAEETLPFDAYQRSFFNAISAEPVEDVATVELILKKHPEAATWIDSKTKNTPLHYAAMKGRTGSLQKLLDFNASLDARNAADMTPLLAAARNGQEKAVLMLTERGAAVNVIDAEGMSPLTYSARKGLTTAVSALAKKGAKLEERSRNGGDALYHAIVGKQTQTAKALISLGADVNAAGIASFVVSKKGEPPAATLVEGVTPLMLCAITNNAELAKHLLNKGADFAKRNSLGMNALDIARYFSGNQAVVNVLEDYLRTITHKKTLNRKFA